MSRYTSETAARKLNIVEAIQYFFPGASDLEVTSIIQQFLSGKTSPQVEIHKKVDPIRVNLHEQYPSKPLFKPDTKPEEVPDDFLRAFGEYKNYDSLWALNYLISRQKNKKPDNKLAKSTNAFGGRIR